MRILGVFSLVAMFLWVTGLQSSQAAFDPGTPLGGAFPAPVELGLDFLGNDIGGGTFKLPGLVTPGDLIMQDALPLGTPTIPSPRTLWSDVVRFFDAPDAAGVMTGFAYLISDGENGVGNIGHRLIVRNFQGLTTTTDLPDALDPNSKFILEGPVNPTVYQVAGGTATYRVHSDVNEIEPIPGAKQPGAIIAGGGGPNGLTMILGENSNAFDPNGNNNPIPVVTNLNLQPGNTNVFDADGSLSDTLNFAAGVVSLTQSDFPVPPTIDLEEAPTIVLDEGTSATYYVQDNVEAVPEPASLILFGAGLLGVARAVWRRKASR